MNKEILELNDSVLHLKLKRQTLKCLEYFEIFTIGELLKRINELRDNKEIFEDIMINLNKYGLKSDSKLGEHSQELRERNQERNKIIRDLNSKLPENIEDLLQSNISILEAPKKALVILNQLGIQTISDLMRFNPIELQEITGLASPLVIKLEESLNHYGLEMGKDFKERKELEEYTEEVQDFEVQTTQAPKKQETVEPQINQALEEQKQTEDIKEESTAKGKPGRKFDRKGWLEKFAVLKIFHAYHRHIFIQTGIYRCCGVDLGGWLGKQRTLYKKGKLPKDLIEMLESIDMVWDLGSSDGKKLKDEYMARNNIKTIINSKKRNEVTTFYKDGTRRSTSDQEFINAIITEGVGEPVTKMEEKTITNNEDTTNQIQEKNTNEYSKQENANNTQIEPIEQSGNQEEIEILSFDTYDTSEQSKSEIKEERTSEIIEEPVMQAEPQVDAKQGVANFLQALKNKQQTLELSVNKNKELIDELKSAIERQKELLKEKSNIEDEIRNIIDSNIELLSQDPAILNSINGINTFILSSSIPTDNEQNRTDIKSRIEIINNQNKIIERKIKDAKDIKNQISELVSSIRNLMNQNNMLEKEAGNLLEIDSQENASGIHF